MTDTSTKLVDLAALSRALDPAIAERTGEVLPRLRKADEYEPLGHDGWEAADLITTLLAQNAALRAERDKWMERCGRERAFASSHFIRAEAAEAEVEKLRGALEKAEQDFYEAANRFQDEDYEGPHEKFTVNVVCHIKPYFDMHMKHLRDSAAAARAALSATTEADNG